MDQLGTDNRPRYKDLSWDELFALLTGETDYSLQEGQLVTAKVASTEGPFVNLRLESGLMGISLLSFPLRVNLNC